MEEVILTDETIEKLSTTIAKRFLQNIEKCLNQGEEAGLLGFLLKSYLQDVQAKQRSSERQPEDREERFLKILSNAPHYIKPLSVEYQKGKEIEKPTTWKKRETL